MRGQGENSLVGEEGSGLRRGRGEEWAEENEIKRIAEGPEGWLETLSLGIEIHLIFRPQNRTQLKKTGIGINLLI